MFARFRCIILLLMMLPLFFGGCTHNDGDIGDLFGRWKLVSLSADGEELPIYNNDVLLYSWDFQGDMIMIRESRLHNEVYATGGMWTRDNDMLMLKFSSSSYAPIVSALHLIDNDITPLNIETLTSSDMRLWYVSDTDGVKYRYVLRKAY